MLTTSASERDRDADAHRGVETAEQRPAMTALASNAHEDFHALKTAPAGFPAGVRSKIYFLFS